MVIMKYRLFGLVVLFLGINFPIVVKTDEDADTLPLKIAKAIDEGAFVSISINAKNAKIDLDKAASAHNCSGLRIVNKKGCEKLSTHLKRYPIVTVHQKYADTFYTNENIQKAYCDFVGRVIISPKDSDETYVIVLEFWEFVSIYEAVDGGAEKAIITEALWLDSERMIGEVCVATRKIETKK